MERLEAERKRRVDQKTGSDDGEKCSVEAIKSYREHFHAIPVNHVNVEKCRIGSDIRLQHASRFMRGLTNQTPDMTSADVMQHIKL